MGIRIIGVKPTDLPPDPIQAHITMETFSWIDEQNRQTGSSSRDVMYDWIVNKKGKAYVIDNNGEQVYIFGAVTPDGQKYIRTAENGKWSDLLIGLEKQAKPNGAS